jgi:hypothetical protein
MMATINPDVFSELTNALQGALLLAGRRATEARAAAGDMDALYNAVSRASSAAHQLRRGPDDDKKEG